MSFRLDLNEQKPFEALVANFIALKRDGLIRPNPDGPDSDKDFTLYVKEMIEMKCDKKAADTGNFYFEIHNTKLNKESGIKATRAQTVYHFVPPNRLFDYEPQSILAVLRGMVKDGRAWIVEGGDNNSRGVVVPIEVLKSTGLLNEQAFPTA